jgi:type VI secretion system secreted protein VgrG
MVTDLQMERIFRPGKYALTDYNFEIPSTSLLSEISTTIAVGGNNKYEVYDFPGEYAKKGEGVSLVKLRMEEQEVKHLFVRGTSSCRAFTSGYKFEMEEYPRPDMNQPYVLTAVSHSVSVGDTYTTGESGGEAQDYSNSFTCIPHKVPFRPQQSTAKPFIQGPQTAVIVGPKGEEIYCDKYARVKAQFHWDREGERDENSSCWIRVSQVHAGKGFGGVDTPRIGEEVIVGFLEGDPDRPIIVGRVYNGQNMPPNGMPGAGMISGLKSNSTPGGGGNNCIMMDDSKGNELYSMNAQYNCTENVGNNRTTTIGVNDSLTVGTDRSETVGSNETIKIGADQTITIGANQTETIGSNCSQSVGSSKTETISIAKALSIGAAYQVSVGAAMNETIGAAKAEEIGGAKMVNVGGISMENVGASKSTNAGSNISEKAGGNISETAGGKVSSTAGGTMTLTATGDFTAKTSAKGAVDAASELVLKCGGASIVLKSGGEITIKGTEITVNGSKIGVKGSGPVTIKGSKVDANP